MQEDGDELESLQADFQHLRASIAHELKLSAAPPPPPPPPRQPMAAAAAAPSGDSFHVLRSELSGCVPSSSSGAARSVPFINQAVTLTKHPPVEPIHASATATATAAMEAMSKTNRVVLNVRRPTATAEGSGMRMTMEPRRTIYVADSEPRRPTSAASTAAAAASASRTAACACARAAAASAVPTPRVTTYPEPSRVSVCAHATRGGMEHTSISAEAASCSSVIFGGAALRAALDSHRAHYELQASATAPKYYVGSAPSAAARRGAPALATAARARRERGGHAPGLNHVRAIEREVVSVTASVAAGGRGRAGAQARHDESDDDDDDGYGGEAGERSGMGGGGSALGSAELLHQQYTRGVGARPKTAQEAWAAAMMGEARAKEVLNSVATHSENLVARVLAELN